MQKLRYSDIRIARWHESTWQGSTRLMHCIVVATAAAAAAIAAAAIAIAVVVIVGILLVLVFGLTVSCQREMSVSKRFIGNKLHEINAPMHIMKVSHSTVRLRNVYTSLGIIRRLFVMLNVLNELLFKCWLIYLQTELNL
uniref:Uncharacterized protein n=1 Tax=Glossina austeni TaxID=7395 RepID=A0A1A9V985_GLOAU